MAKRVAFKAGMEVMEPVVESSDEGKSSSRRLDDAGAEGSAPSPGGASRSPTEAGPSTSAPARGHARKDSLAAESIDLSVPVSLREIAKFMYAADEAELQRDRWPRVAFLIRAYAYRRANVLDPENKGREVLQFKTILNAHLDKTKFSSLPDRRKNDDIEELQEYYEKYRLLVEGKDGGNFNTSGDAAKLIRAIQTAGAVFDVLDFHLKEKEKKEKLSKRDHDTLQSGQLVGKAREKLETEVFNILPLHNLEAPIMKLSEVSSVHGLVTANSAAMHHHDVFNFLIKLFGFQEHNALNQKENLVMLVANAHVRQQPWAQQLGHSGDLVLEAACEEVMEKLLGNYYEWCNFLKLDHTLTPVEGLSRAQNVILYAALFLLVWGEAANLRFLPECLCYIFHHMAKEIENWQKEGSPPLYSSLTEYLADVVEPVYKALAKEAAVAAHGKAPHASWRNYDDFNEFFWTTKCLELGWPWNLDHSFFRERLSGAPRPRGQSQPPPRAKVAAKEKFVEHRTWWHLFRSFDRQWIFMILVFQYMVITRFHGPSFWGPIRHRVTRYRALTCLITYAGWQFLQAFMDIWLSGGTILHGNLKTTILQRLFVLPALRLAWLAALGAAYWLENRYFIREFVNMFSPVRFSTGFDAVCLLYVVVNWGLPLLQQYFPGRRLRACALWVFNFLATPELYVGNMLKESLGMTIKYCAYWIGLLTFKVWFSWRFEVAPLVEPTQAILDLPDQLRPRWPAPDFGKVYILTLASIWGPAVMIFLFDTLFWEYVLSCILGGIEGALLHLGEVRTLGMMRLRFKNLAAAFNARFIPDSNRAQRGSAALLEDLDEAHDDPLGPRFLRAFSKKLTNSFQRVRGNRGRGGYTGIELAEEEALYSRVESAPPPSETDTVDIQQAARFGIAWNDIIQSLREEDLISDRELEVLVVPTSERDVERRQWPLFLLANQVEIAFKQAASARSDSELCRSVKRNMFRSSAVTNAWHAFKDLLHVVVKGERELAAIEDLLREVERALGSERFLQTFNMKKLQETKFHAALIRFADLLVKPDTSTTKSVAVSKSLQDMFEIIMKDVLDKETAHRFKTGAGPLSGAATKELFVSRESLNYPPPSTKFFKALARQFRTLLEIPQPAGSDVLDPGEVPVNGEARRRLTFFTNSILMKMPVAPPVREMLALTVMTPYYKEDVLFTMKQIYDENEDGISILYYLQTIFPDEWRNFLERVGAKSEDELRQRGEEGERVLREWASFRGQTLSRTVRGMCYYRRALMLAAKIENATLEMEGGHTLSTETLSSMVDSKFVYVASCQVYGAQRAGTPEDKDKAKEIAALMKQQEALRVAYIDETEEPEGDGRLVKIYYSVLLKCHGDAEQEIYRIRLPGQFKLGEGKPENQNHAVIFSRGEAMQTIDMNQDGYLEEAWKIRNLLEEFHYRHCSPRRPTILGLREHVFTGGVSSLAQFMSLQELSFVTIGQRALAARKIRFHYGHPDIFDRLFHITRGGMSKASRVINISEDIFAGFNSILRDGDITHHEYIQVGKGRDVGLNQISLFEAKVASGNGEQVLSRDVFRLGRRLDFFRHMCFYFTSLGFYVSSFLSVITIYVLLYGRVYLALSGIEALLLNTLQRTEGLNNALVPYAYFQLGFLTALPMVMQLGLEHGLPAAVWRFLVMQLQGGWMFFTFGLGTRAHYFSRTVLHGGAAYRETGRGFVVRHIKFAENYRLYSRSHFNKAFEMLFLLIVYTIYTTAPSSNSVYIATTFSLWLVVISWLYTPFYFNPSGFEWKKTVDDWEDFSKWMRTGGGVGIKEDASWETWWDKEQSHLMNTTYSGLLVELVLALRFFLFQYMIVYNLKSDGPVEVTFRPYVGSLIVGCGLLLLAGVLTLPRQMFGLNAQIYVRFGKSILIAAVVAGVAFLLSTEVLRRNVGVSIVAYTVTGWAIIQTAQVVRGFIHKMRGGSILDKRGLNFWGGIQSMAKVYEYGMATLLFVPIAVLAFVPVTHEFQTRVLFNQAFSSGLAFSRVLAGKKKSK